MNSSTCGDMLNQTSMSIILRNCKNIDSAQFTIAPNKLNVKYAPNGTGKTSLSQGLLYQLGFEGISPESLIPFKYRDNHEAHPFECTGLNLYSRPLLYDERFVSNVVFQESGVFTHSYDVFIKTSELDSTTEQIKELLREVRLSLDSQCVRQLRSDLKDFIANSSGKNGISVSNTLKKTTPIIRALEEGNKQENIPSECSAFEPFIRADFFVDWCTWHSGGSSYVLTGLDKCPYCAGTLKDKESSISAVSSTYTKQLATNLNRSKQALRSVKSYLINESYERALSIYSSSTPPNSSESLFLTQVIQQASVIVDNLDRAERLPSFFELTNLADIEETLRDSVIDLELLHNFNSIECAGLLEKYNNAINDAAKSASKLSGIVIRQKKLLATSISNDVEEINRFLNDAGYPYCVHIPTPDNETCQVLLIHRETNYQLNDTRNALSYGERNALALIFFMYEALHNKSDFIILDDPITSFDGNKRFALLSMLFLKEQKSDRSLKNKTVLLLTHDYGVVYDLECPLKCEFQPMANTTLLSINNGILSERVIEPSDMHPLNSLLDSLCRESIEILTKVIYYRRFLELTQNKGIEWDVLSSLFHHRQTPLDSTQQAISPTDLREAEMAISKAIQGKFDYNEQLAIISNPAAMLDLFDSAECDYERLQLCRVALDLGTKRERSQTGLSRIDRKWINETLHIDNGYVYQLDPRHFNMIPESLLMRCRGALLSMTEEMG